MMLVTFHLFSPEMYSGDFYGLLKDTFEEAGMWKHGANHKEHFSVEVDYAMVMSQERSKPVLHLIKDDENVEVTINGEFDFSLKAI
jgi:hypothetical protein